VAKRSQNTAFRSELARAAAVLALSSALGFTVNALSAHPVSIFAGDASGKPAGAADAPRIPRISIADLIAATKRNDLILVVDVRGEAEFAIGHIPGSLHAPIETILQGQQDVIGTLQAAEKSGAMIVTLCDSELCEKSDQAAEALSKLGYKNVRVLQGGYQAYFDAHAPIEEGVNR